MTVTLPKLLNPDADFAYTALFYGGFLPALIEYEDGRRYKLVCSTVAAVPANGPRDRLELETHLDSEMLPHAQTITASLFTRAYGSVLSTRAVGFASPYGGYPDKALEVWRIEANHAQRTGGQLVTGLKAIAYQYAGPGPLPESMRIKP